MTDFGFDDLDAETSALSVDLAEVSLLSTMLASPSAAMAAQAEGLQAGMFSRPEHAQAFEHIMRCARQHGGPDISVIAESMTAGGLPISVLHRLTAVGAPGSRAAVYAEQVREQYLARSMAAYAAAVSKHCSSGNRGSTILSAAREELWRIETGHRQVTGQQDFRAVVEDVANRSLLGDSDTTTALLTPWDSVNRIMRGTKPGRMVVLGGRPGMGKTSIAEEWGVWLARQGVPTGFVSIEMNQDELAARALAQLARIPLSELDDGQLSGRHGRQLDQAVAELRAAPFYVDEMSEQRPTVSNVESVIAWWVARHQVRVVFVDNVQIMSSDERWGGNRHQQLAEVSGRFKKMAKRYGIVVVVLSQITREAANRAVKRPALSDLKESGALEQDADQVLLAHRPEEYAPDDETVRGVLELIVAKNRNGPTGMAQCTWIGQHVRVADGRPAERAGL